MGFKPKSDYFDPYRLMFVDAPKRPDAGDGIRSFKMPYLKVAKNSFTFLTLLSDIHAESAASFTDMVKAELKRAREWANKGANSRILLNGDVLDLILPSDLKRFTPSVHTTSVSAQDDLIGLTLDHAEELFKPYADLIDVIGMGNHETALLKHHSFNITRELARRLSTSEHTVHHAGYAWYVVYQFRRAEAGAYSRFVVYANHGRSRAPKTRGVLEFRAIAETYRDAQVYWLGHNHFKNQDWDVEVGLDRNNEVSFNEVAFVRTGSYMNFTQDGYAAKAGYAPQPHGGAFVVIHHRDTDYKYKVIM